MSRKMKIKFSHRYNKLQNIQNGDTAILCHVIPTKFEDLPGAMKFHDTLFWDTETLKEGHYELPENGDCMILLFVCKGMFFPTIRSRTYAKMGYYMSNVGHEFEVVIG